MMKRTTALLLALCMLLAAAPVYAGAATGQQVVAGTATVAAGSSTSVTVKAENFSSIATAEIYVYYDASALTLYSTSDGSLLSGAQTSVNTSEAGTVKLVAMSLEGISGSGDLLTLYFQTSSTCTPGTYPIRVAIGGAYDTSLAPAAIGSTNGSITVNKPIATETFSIYSYVNATTLQKDDVLSYRVANGYYQSFVSGDFTVEYDHEVFALDSVTLEAALTGEGALYSVNSSVLGQVRIAYASQTPVSASSLFIVKLKVITDKNATTTVRAQASNMYREDLSAYLPGNTSASLTLQQQEQAVDHPNAFLRTEALITGKQSRSVFTLEAGAGVAAADFTLTYDPAVLRCVKVEQAQLPNGGMVVINDHYADGSIRFSYIHMEGYSETEVPLVSITWEPICSPTEHYQITAGGVGVVDTKGNVLTLEYVTDTGCLHQATVTPPTCLEDGFTTYTCNACGDTYVQDTVEKLGHDIRSMEAKAPTCDEGGWEACVACSRCFYSDSEVVFIPALGHDLVSVEALAPSCLEDGWEAHESCTRCDHTTKVTLPALGHRVIQLPTEDPIEIDNSSAVPFVLTDGTYYSQNHDSYSTSLLILRAKYDCLVTLTYGVSSEAGWDKLALFHNNAQMDEISGSVTDQVRSVSLSAGDTITVRYSKDGSVDRDEDRGWVKIEQQALPVDLPAENEQPTCTEAVVCDYCSTVVKEPLGHSVENGTCLKCGSVLVLAVHNGEEKFYDTLDAALAAQPNGFIRLYADHAQDIALSKTVCLDLNSFDLTGNVTIAEGATLYVFDSATADYTAENRGRIIGSIEGDLARSFNTPASSGHNYKYMALQEEDGVWSFHRYYLAVKSVVLVPYAQCNDGMGIAVNYRTMLRCSEFVAGYVTAYGAKLTGDTTVYANYEGIPLGTENSFVTRLDGIVKTSNTWSQNLANAQLAPVVSAYISLADGTQLESAAVSKSAAQLIAEANDAQVTVLQQWALGAMYDTFGSVLEQLPGMSQKLDAIRAYAAKYCGTAIIFSHPEDVTAAIGSNAVFCVDAGGEGLTYQWQYSKDGGNSWYNSSSSTVGYNTDTLTVGATAARNGFMYRCKITDADGNVLITDPATLTAE